MATNEKMAGTAEAWENGDLGASTAHAKAVDPGLAEQIDEALGLQPISIRLPKATIEVYKLLASLHGVGYQPLMRDALKRFAESEMKMQLAAAVESQREQSEQRKKVRGELGVEMPPRKRALKKAA